MLLVMIMNLWSYHNITITILLSTMFSEKLFLLQNVLGLILCDHSREDFHS